MRDRRYTARIIVWPIIYIAAQFINRFYPLRKIVITSTDPYFITPVVKSQLQRKNRLVRAGRLEEAEALAKQIRGAILQQHHTAVAHQYTPTLIASNVFDSL